jgi:hypothetical protein
MPLPVPATNVAHDGSSSRRIGTLVQSEEWWRDRYYDFAAHGYRLRPRYHPRWEPSWVKARKDFYAVEDGLATIVRFCFMFLGFLAQELPIVTSSDGCRARAGWPPSNA